MLTFAYARHPVSRTYGALWLGAYYNLMTGNHVGIEAVQWLTVCHHDVVGDIHDIVDWSEADDIQLVLQPLWAFLHLAVGDVYAGIALASLGALNLYIDRKILVIYYEFIARWTVQAGLITILLQPA